jgi:hypothetical protein
MGLLINKGGRCNKAPYQQSSVRCPDPATPQMRTILNMYRELYQNKSASDADNFLNQIEMFAINLYADNLSGGGISGGGNDNTGGKNAESAENKAIQEIADKIKQNEPGYKRNSASALCKSVIAIAESIA